MVGVVQGCPILFLEMYHLLGFNFNSNKAQFIQQIEI